MRPKLQEGSGNYLDADLSPKCDPKYQVMRSNRTCGSKCEIGPFFCFSNSLMKKYVENKTAGLGVKCIAKIDGGIECECDETKGVVKVDGKDKSYKICDQSAIIIDAIGNEINDSEFEDIIDVTDEELIPVKHRNVLAFKKTPGANSTQNANITTEPTCN